MNPFKPLIQHCTEFYVKMFSINVPLINDISKHGEEAYVEKIGSPNAIQIRKINIFSSHGLTGIADC